jgi:hypothetical protein
LHIPNSSSLSVIEKASRNRDILAGKAARGESTVRSLRAKRSISLPAPMKEKSLFEDSDDDDYDDNDQARQEPRIMLPLERYAKKQTKGSGRSIQRLLKTKKQEVASCESKIRLASQQNAENEKGMNVMTCGK